MMQLEWAKKLPEAWRLLRTSLRPGHMAGVSLITASVFALLSILVATILLADSNTATGGFSFSEYFKSLYIISLVLQGIIWLVGAPALVGSSVTTEYMTNTWIFQRTTPQPASKLLLGKLLGTPGDVYVASATLLPFTLATAALTRFSMAHLLGICIITLAASLLFSCLFLLVSCVTEKQKNISMGISFLMIMVLFMTWIASMDSPTHLNGTVAMLHPMIIVEWLVETAYTEMPASYAQRYIYFYGMNLPPIAFALFFYACWGACFFACADAHIRRKSGFLVNRLPLALLLLMIDFFIIGFQQNLRGTDDALIFIAVINTVFFYSIIIMHTLPLRDVKPWAYRKGAPGWNFFQYFESDAPSVYIVAVLLPLHFAATYFLWWSSNHGLFSAPNEPTFPGFVFYVLLFTSIIIRDSLFLQFCHFKWSKGLVLATIIYAIGFIGVTIISAVGSASITTFIDLTPFSSFVQIFRTSSAGGKDYMLISTTVNSILAIFFWVFSSQPLRKAGEDLKHDISQ